MNALLMVILFLVVDVAADLLRRRKRRDQAKRREAEAISRTLRTTTTQELDLPVNVVRIHPRRGKTDGR